jgi:methanogenic corrinoid protein MtbC1
MSDALILKAARTSMTVRELYLGVIQPSQRELGALWETGQITVAQEHVVTAITQSVISQLYSQFPFGSRNGLRALIACAPGELHELGARMVADFLELEGWDVVFLGASTPIPDVIRAVLEHKSHVFGISATIAFNLPAAVELISGMREKSNTHPVKIVAGGRAFGLSQRMPQQVAADGYSPDAEDAVRLFQQLLLSKG